MMGILRRRHVIKNPAGGAIVFSQFTSSSCYRAAIMGTLESEECFALSRSLATARPVGDALGRGRHHDRTWLSQSFRRFASPRADGLQSRPSRMAGLCVLLHRISWWFA